MTDGPRVLWSRTTADPRMVAANLAAHRVPVVEAGDVREALRCWEAGRPDVVVLDLGLPDRDGTVVIRRIRREAATPILILSARGEEHDKVAALEEGADDYVTKPFGLASCAPACRRSCGGRPARPADATGRMRLGNVVLDVPRREVRSGVARFELTPREYELLKAMMAQPDRVITEGRLLRAVWGDFVHERRATTSTSTSAACGASWPPRTRRIGRAGG